MSNYCFTHFFLYICQKYNIMILYKFLFFILIFAILNTIKDIAVFIMSFMNDQKINFSKTRMVFLGLSISYILTIIFTGFDI